MFQKIAKHRANDASNDVHRPPLVPEQVEEGGGRKQTRNLMERAQDLYAYIVHEYFNVTDSDAPMWDSDKQNIRSPLEQSFRFMNTREEAQIAAEDGVSYY